MKTRKLFFAACATMILGAFVITGCSKDVIYEDLILSKGQEDSDHAYLSWFGVQSSVDYESYENNNIVTDYLVAEFSELFLSEWNVANASVMTFDDNSIGIVASSSDSQFLAIRVDFLTDGTLKVKYYKIDFIYNFDSGGDILYTVEYRDKNDELRYIINLEEGSISVFDGEGGVFVEKADPEELGPRRPTETFNDCFVRNWTNFGTDFISLIAQIAAPKEVAAAIALVCVF